MGNGDSGGGMLKETAKGAATGATIGAIAGPEGALIGGAVGGLVGAATSFFSGGPSAQHLQANVGGGSIDAHTIYAKISQGRTDSLDNGKSSAETLQRTHTDRANQIDALNKKMGGAWQGSSAEAATGGANALKMWHDDSAKNLGTSRSFITNQIDAFHDVHGKVQKLPDDPPSMGWSDHFPWSDKDDEINKYNQDSQTNVQAYTAYYGSSNQNAGGMPQYNNWQGNNISDGGGNPGGPGGSGIGSGPGGAGIGGGGGGGFSPSANTPKFNTPSTNTPKVDTPTANNPKFNTPKTDTPSFTPPNDNTSASSYVPPSMDHEFGPGGGGFGPGGVGGGGFGPGGSGSGSGSGSGAGGIGSAGFGPGGFGAAGGMGSGAAAEGAGGGAGSGMRGSGMSAAGAAGKAGSSGMGGMGGARGGGKKGEDDQEHQTKYLVEEDNNELFGSDQLTVPPVIGE
ncbi:hypothetical protein GCM10022222_17430 [Amycolatopsis ultiminotia]|uniref:Glycine zipper n=1 Tax=Amycolatopsis ultiminotia TaxID=543629 RepID=A0ABP6VIJ3_9PSEU